MSSCHRPHHVPMELESKEQVKERDCDGNRTVLTIQYSIATYYYRRETKKEKTSFWASASSRLEGCKSCSHFQGRVKGCF